MIVLGGGPGGYVATIRAAQLGAEVHLVEAEKVGGTCLNVGCIPTKVLLHTAELYQSVLYGESIGLKAGNVEIDWDVLMQRKQTVIDRLVGGVEGLLKANKVKIHKGRGVLEDAHTVRIGENEVLNGDYIILALGSVPVHLNFPGADLPGVIDSSDALSLSKPPASIVIVGGGVIGVEFASLYASLGCKTTVVELLPEILPMIDGEMTALIKAEMEKLGVTFMNQAKLTKVEQGSDCLISNIDCDEDEQQLSSELVLVAVGRKPNTESVGLEKLGIQMDRNKILVNNSFETNIPGVYAIGDCNGQIMLAHAASAQGIAAVEHALGHQPAYFPDTIPSCIYTGPEVAGVGMTEEQVKEQGIAYKVGRFPLAGNGKTVIENDGVGMVKIIAGKKHGEILGVHIMGPRATDIIAEAALAIRLEATEDELISTIHAHPTISESMGEAALSLEGIAIHWLNN